MKKYWFQIMFVTLVALISFACSANAQSYKSVNGSIVKVEKAKADSVVDQVVGTRDGITFYQGARGGIYYWKTSSKTGKLHKVYLKKE
jgi:hypothetical protein